MLGPRRLNDVYRERKSGSTRKHGGVSKKTIFYIIIIDDEYLVRRCVGLQLVLALLLAPPHTVVVDIFYVCVTHLYTFRTVCMLKDLFWLQ